MMGHAAGIQLFPELWRVRTQQVVLEDVPRQLAKYGPQTAFFSTNDGMQEPLIRAVLTAKQGYFIEQSTPAPTAGYPSALGLAIPPDKKGDMAWISAENGFV